MERSTNLNHLIIFIHDFMHGINRIETVETMDALIQAQEALLERERDTKKSSRRFCSSIGRTLAASIKHVCISFRSTRLHPN